MLIDLMGCQGGKNMIAEACDQGSLHLGTSGSRGFVRTRSKYQFQKPFRPSTLQKRPTAAQNSAASLGTISLNT